MSRDALMILALVSLLGLMGAACEPHTQQAFALFDRGGSTFGGQATGSGGNGNGSGPPTITIRGRTFILTVAAAGSINCSDFACQADAQAYFNALASATGAVDAAGLDGNPPNGQACDGVLTGPCPTP